MMDRTQFYIGGQWVDPAVPSLRRVINPATEAPCGSISMGSASDVDRAVSAARAAFPAFSQSGRDERVALLERIVAEYQKRYDEIAAATTLEMGAPVAFSHGGHTAMGLGHFQTALEILRTYEFSSDRGGTRLVREPIGVCGLITPWNFPINQIAVKVAPALATGSTMVLKPSEIAPFSAAILAEVFDAAGVPAGVFNLVNGDGPTVGAALSRHPDVDLLSFTGSTRAGIQVAKDAADTVKRVHQELGGKSPNIVLPDADLGAAVAAGVHALMMNSGQSCIAPSRMLVPADRMDEAAAAAREAAQSVTVGNPADNPEIGPVASKAQWEKIQALIARGIDEGARLAAGGTGRPDALEHGFYVRPTVFSHATNDMEIAREEIFGPVLTIIGYEDVDEAIRIANDTPFGLAAYVQGADPIQLRSVASRLRAGQVYLNGAAMDMMAPFGGYKQSGNGREWGDLAFQEFLEVKAVLGDTPAQAA